LPGARSAALCSNAAIVTPSSSQPPERALLSRIRYTDRMIETGPASEHEMVLAFLRAEIDSPRFGGHHVWALNQVGCDRSIIDRADLTNENQNIARKQVLAAVRGYGTNAWLFRGFPVDVRWRRVTLEPHDFKKLLYANEETWIRLSDGTRLVSTGAQNVADGKAERGRRKISWR
jgi:hypothetical protein